MRLLNKIASAANTVLMTLAGFFAVMMLLSGLYILNDIFYTNRTAFVSHDLMQYRPQIPDASGQTDYSFDELRNINPDTVGWLELFDTHINYPVVQGDNNLEYLNKDIFGYSAFTGSVYLAAENQDDFGDWYNLIYGHHMENGAMFGDIEKYLDPEYFASHSEGILQTEHMAYRVHVFACVLTNAYEDLIYQKTENAESQYPILRDYIQEHAVNLDSVPDDLSDNQLLGMSTCSDAMTDGRLVLFASVSPWTDQNNMIPEDQKDSVKTQKSEQHSVSGHILKYNKWSLLNLLCMLCILLTLLSGCHKKKKIGLLSEACIAVFSAVLFFQTQDFNGYMGMQDQYTGLMIALSALSLMTDIFCSRASYQGGDVI